MFQDPGWYNVLTDSSRVRFPVRLLAHLPAKFTDMFPASLLAGLVAFPADTQYRTPLSARDRGSKPRVASSQKTTTRTSSRIQGMMPVNRVNAAVHRQAELELDKPIRDGWQRLPEHLPAWLKDPTAATTTLTLQLNLNPVSMVPTTPTRITMLMTAEASRQQDPRRFKRHLSAHLLAQLPASRPASVALPLNPRLRRAMTQICGDTFWRTTPITEGCQWQAHR